MKKLFLLLVLSSFYSFSQDSLNVQKPKLSVIELEKIKVVYRGISNPITIAVPSNVKSFIVSGPGVSTTDVIGKYNVRPGSGTELIIKVEMTFLDNSVVVEEHVYNIKGLPRPIGTLNDEYSTRGYLEFTKEELKDAIVGIKMVDFIYNVNFRTISFSLFSDNKKIFVEGNKVNEEAFLFISKLKKNSILIIDFIKYPTYGACFPPKVQPIVIKII